MPDEHPNIAVVKRFNPADAAGSTDVLAEDVVFHFFNPALPDMQGGYTDPDGLQTFFANMANTTNGAFKVNSASIAVVGKDHVNFGFLKYAE